MFERTRTWLVAISTGGLVLAFMAGCSRSAREASPAERHARLGEPRLEAWLSDSMVKVGPSEPPHPPLPLELFAAKNEFESAQIHLHAAGAQG